MFYELKKLKNKHSIFPSGSLSLAQIHLVMKYCLDREVKGNRVMKILVNMSGKLQTISMITNKYAFSFNIPLSSHLFWVVFLFLKYSQ